jgi:hypothetical protein
MCAGLRILFDQEYWYDHTTNKTLSFGILLFTRSDQQLKTESDVTVYPCNPRIWGGKVRKVAISG